MTTTSDATVSVPALDDILFTPICVPDHGRVRMLDLMGTLSSAEYRALFNRHVDHLVNDTTREGAIACLALLEEVSAFEHGSVQERLLQAALRVLTMPAAPRQ